MVCSSEAGAAAGQCCKHTLCLHTACNGTVCFKCVRPTHMQAERHQHVDPTALWGSSAAVCRQATCHRCRSQVHQGAACPGAYVHLSRGLLRSKLYVVHSVSRCPGRC